MSGITQDRIDRVLSSLRTTHSPLSEADRQEAASVIVHLWSDYRREAERRQRLEGEAYGLRERLDLLKERSVLALKFAADHFSKV